MAKKKHKKKHSFQHKNAPATVAKPTGEANSVSKAAKPSTMPNEWSEVRADVRKTLVLGGFFIMLMIALWLIFEYTSVGPNVYNSLKL